MVEAWKLDKARDVAKAAADKLADAVRELGAEYLRKSDNVPAFEKAVKDALKDKPYRQFELKDLALLAYQHSPTRPDAGGYGPPRIDADKIQYPAEDTVAKLMELRDKPLGETVVIADAPRQHFYVCTLVKREEATPDKFRSDVYERVATNLNPLYSNYVVRDALESGLKAAMDRLKAEMKYAETDAMKEKDGEEKKRGR